MIAPRIVTFPAATVPNVIGAIDHVCRNARNNYAPANHVGDLSHVDFHPYAATSARKEIAEVLTTADGGDVTVKLSIQQVEAVSKILKGTKLRTDLEWRKSVVPARKAVDGAFAAMMGSSLTDDED